MRELPHAHAPTLTMSTIRDFLRRPPGSRRVFLADLGLGFTGLALGAMLRRDALAESAAWPRRPGASSGCS